MWLRDEIGSAMSKNLYKPWSFGIIMSESLFFSAENQKNHWDIFWKKAYYTFGASSFLFLYLFILPILSLDPMRRAQHLLGSITDLEDLTQKNGLGLFLYEKSHSED